MGTKAPPKKCTQTAVAAWIKSLKLTPDQTEIMTTASSSLMEFWSALEDDHKGDGLKKLAIDWGMAIPSISTFKDQDLITLIAAARALAY